MKSLIVVDCQYDFIDGTLACENAENAIKNIIEYINNNEVRVHYSKDWHTLDNKSFSVNGGIWPIHCVQGQKGSEIHYDFTKQINDLSKRPTDKNTYYKGIEDEVEEYSAYNAKNKSGVLLRENLEKEVIVAGIASEYCVRETIVALLKDGYKLTILIDGLGYVNTSDHLKNLEDLREKGVKVITGK